VLPLTPVIVVVASFLVVGETDFTALSVDGVPRAVIAVTLSPDALTAPPVAVAFTFVVVAVPCA
jgi:hypothetical protein